MRWCLCCVAPVPCLHTRSSPHLHTHLFLSSSRQILPRDQIILHAHKREREKERGTERGGVGGGLELDDVIM